MYTYVQITDKHNQSYVNCFKMTINDQHALVLKYIAGHIKQSFIIPLADMKTPTIDHAFDNDQISFEYDDLEFEFIENGYGEISYLEKNFFNHLAA